MWLAAAIAVGGCGGAARPVKPVAMAPAEPPAAAPAPRVERPQTSLAKSDAPTMTMTIADGPPAIPSAVPTPLDEKATNALLARLEPMPDVTTGNPLEPTLRPPSAPPSAPTNMVPLAFSAPTGKAVGAAPLATANAQPEAMPAPTIAPTGDIRSEAEVRIRFADPMVPVAQVNTDVTGIATIAPAAAGHWRWIDTRVLGFFADNRFARSTTYTVTVPAGGKALTGRTIAMETRASFTTAPLDITELVPAQIRFDSAIAVKFDQAIDQAAVAPFLRVWSVDRTTYKRKGSVKAHVVPLAQAHELWKRMPHLELADKDLGANYILLAPDTEWPAGADIQVELRPNAPSKEGSSVSTTSDYASAEVVRKFTLETITCSSNEVTGDGLGVPPSRVRCEAGYWGELFFTNEIEPSTFKPEKLHLDGEETQDHSASYSEIGFRVPEVPNRSYKMTIGDGIADKYGQPYVGPHQLTIPVIPQIYWPSLTAPSGMHIIDTRFDLPQWIVDVEQLVSVHIDLYKVTPADYFAYQDYESKKRATPPGTRVFSKTFPVGKGQGGNLRVDLAPALKNNVGHVVAVATPIAAAPIQKNWWTPRLDAWIQVTKLGLAVRWDHEKVATWTRDISPAHFLDAIPNTAIAIWREGDATPLATSSGDATGHATFDTPQTRTDPTKYPRAIVVASAGDDSTFAAFDGDRAKRSEKANWFVTDDRFTYKPGEKVYFKGWVRWTDTGVNPQLAMPKAGESVTWTLTDASRNKIANGSAPLSDQGGFDITATIPPTVNLGDATLSLTSRSEHTDHTIAIQEFRTPVFGVALNDDVQFSGARAVYAGEQLDMHAEANYYAGGGLPGAPIQWDARLAGTRFSPPGWNDFSFRPPTDRSMRGYAYRWGNRYGDDDEPDTSFTDTKQLTGGSTSDASFAIARTPKGHPAILTVDTTVTDIDRMRIRASSRPIIVHPSRYYVGLHAHDEDSTKVDVIVSDVDGNAVPGVNVSIDIEAVFGSERFKSDAEVKEKQHCTVTSTVEPIVCTYKRTSWEWAYSATATVSDERDRANRAQIDLPWWSHDKEADFAVVPEHTSYKPGETAKVEIKSKQLPSFASVTIARNGMISQQMVALTKPSTMIDVPIEMSQMPGIHLIVDRWSIRTHTRPGSTLPLPHYDHEEVSLPIDTSEARLNMVTKPDKPLVGPGEVAGFEVRVKHGMKPVANAEVALFVVDEGVLAVSGRSFADPLEPFLTEYGHMTGTVATLDLVRDQGPELKGTPGMALYHLGSIGTIGHGSGTGSGYGMGGGRGELRGRSPDVIKSRKDFRPNALFAPLLHTDANGIAHVTVKMPDNLTRFRIVAMATAQTQLFGKAESAITTQVKLNVRTVAPRFLTQGDTFDLPVVIQNLDAQTRTVDVAVRAANLSSRGIAGQRITLDGGQRAELRFPFATIGKGKAAIQTVLVSGSDTDSSVVTLPVYEPATTESFATYGIVDDKPQFEQLAVPAKIFADVGGVEVEVASTQMQSLTDAFWYLYAYPYECAEQRSSRMLATAGIIDVLDAFATPGRPTRTEIAEMQAEDLKVLQRDQLAGGGWGYFSGMTADPFVSMQVLAALGAMKATGPVMTRAIAFTNKTIADTLKVEHTPYAISLAATGLTALAAAGVDVGARAEQLHARAVAERNYPVDAKARLLALLAKRGNPRIRAQLVKELLSATHETAAAATVTTTYDDREQLLLVSSVKTNALVLDALIREVPEHSLIPKLARGVLDSRLRGRWATTQENLAVINAMHRYFDAYEKAVPNYTGKLWFGHDAYVEQAFVGRSGARGTAHLDWTTLAPGSTHDVAVTKDGPGRLYYRLGITYAPQRTDLPALDAGFLVHRSYTAIDDPADVQVLADGRVKIRLGARVLVTIETTNTSKRTAVAVVDPLPAGLESVNTHLANAERAANVVQDTRWSFRD
ncbi:MAG TPA: alpha-2-macroglobulin family protein, partial [Kofleriaceae bacterium]